MLAVSDLEWFGKLYAPNSADHADPRLALDRASASVLANLPPVLVLTNEFDPTRQEAEDFAAGIVRAGGVAEVRRLDGLVHAAFWLSGPVPRHREYHDAIVTFLRPILASGDDSESPRR